MAFTMASITCFRLSWVFLIAVPIMGFGLVLITVKAHPTFVKVFNEYDDLNNSVKENLEGIRVVKSYNREDFEKEKFGKVSWFIYSNFAKAEKLLAFNIPLVLFTVHATILAISYLGARLIASDAFGGLKGDIDSCEERMRNLKLFFADKTDFTIVPLEDPYGTTIYEDDFEAIVVSEETEPTAVEINNIRVSKGMKPLDIIVVSFVLAYDGNPISSTRIRSGEINQKGLIINQKK